MSAESLFLLDNRADLCYNESNFEGKVYGIFLCCFITSVTVIPPTIPMP